MAKGTCTISSLFYRNDEAILWSVCPSSDGYGDWIEMDMESIEMISAWRASSLHGDAWS